MPIVDLIKGMDFGSGVDLGGQLFGDAVQRSEGQEVADTGGQSEDILLTLVEQQQDQDSALQLSTSISASYGLFGGSAKFDLSQDMHVHRYSVSLVIRATVFNSFKQMRDVQLTQTSQDLIKNGNADRFKEQFGDFFVRGVQTGGEFCAVLQIIGRDESDLTDIRGSLRAGGILGAVNASTQDSFSSLVGKATAGRETKLRHFQIGGIPKASIDPSEMVAHALGFAAEVKSGQSQAFQALVVPYKTIDLPFAPNFVDIESAKDVVATLMQRRRDLMTRLTSFTFVIAHPELFEIAPTLLVNDIVGNLEIAVAAITSAASRCVNKPAEASLALAGLATLDVPLDQLPNERPTAIAPNIAGTYQSTDLNATIHINQDGPFITWSLINPNYEHHAGGKWTASAFDIVVTRKFIVDGCVTEMFGSMMVSGRGTLHLQIVGTDGRCDLPTTFTETSDWERT